MALRDRQRWIWEHVDDGGRLLDVGCWDGLGTATLTDKAESLYGIDPDPAVFQGPAEVARTRASADRLPFRAAAFDTVVFSEVLEHLPRHMERPALWEIRRVIRAGGRLLLTTPHKGWFAWLDPMDAKRRLGFNHPGHRHYTRQQIEELLDGLFAIEVFERSALLLYPLSTALGAGNLNRCLRLRTSVSDWEYRHDFGRASFNLMLVARAQA